MVIYTKLEIEGVEYTPDDISISKTIDDFNSTSNFTTTFNNYVGRYDNAFALNNEVTIYADKDVNPPTTKLFIGVIENIDYDGSEMKERMRISGRDYGAILQDILCSPRIFKNQEVSTIVESILNQNVRETGITWNNINVTGTTIDTITFNNISVFDAIKQLAEIVGYYFYIDNDKDIHFEERESISSGLTFDNTNVTSAKFKTTDNDIFNYISVYGDRQLTGVRQFFTSATTGSTFILDDKPSNVFVIASGTNLTYLQPGGILNVDDPAEDNIKWIMDYNSRTVTLTSGVVAGDNTGWAGSPMFIDYQRSSPIISVRQDATSQSLYGKKQKNIIDKNIKSLVEANARANTLLSELKQPKTQGTIMIRGVVNAAPGNTALINIPFHNVVNQTYMILSAEYRFTKQNLLSDEVLTLNLNKKIKSFFDYAKELEMRLRALEASDYGASVTNVELGTGSVVLAGSYMLINRSIGSAFYFHVPNHNLFQSPSSLLGDMRAGSTIVEGSY